MKLFEKLNKRNIRKGLPELTFSEFLEREEKACHSNTNGSAFHVLLAVFCTFLGFAAVILTSGFPHLSDGIFFVIITLTIEGLLMYALYKPSCYNVSCKLKWIESKRNEAECEIQTEKWRRRQINMCQTKEYDNVKGLFYYFNSPFIAPIMMILLVRWNAKKDALTVIRECMSARVSLFHRIRPIPNGLNLKR